MKNWVWLLAFLLSFAAYFMPPLIGLLWAVGVILFAYVSPLIHPFFISSKYK